MVLVVQCGILSTKTHVSRPFYEINLQNRCKMPTNIVVRSELSGTGSPHDAYPLAEFQLDSKVRGICFYAVTAVVAIFLLSWWPILLLSYLIGTEGKHIILLQRFGQLYLFFHSVRNVKRCIHLVKKGASVFFFPEGPRSKDGKMGKFKKGAFSVAAKTGAPVVPITLLGTGDLMPAGMEGTLNSGTVKVVIHKPIKGNNPEILCEKARNAIADVLIHHS